MCRKMDESDKQIAVVLGALFFGVCFFFVNVAVYRYVILKEKSSLCADDFSCRAASTEPHQKPSGRFK